MCCYNGLLNAAVWPDSIQISPWYFKPPADAKGRSAAPSAAAVSADVDNTGNLVVNTDDINNTVCMSDDTILTADNLCDGI